MTLRIAHRGDPRGFRENTLPAIEGGVAAGADLVEVDVRVTADGHTVLLHDPTLERLWGDPRPVAALTLRDVRQVAAASGGWEIPTLDEALDLAADLDTELMLDVTSVPIALATEDVVRARGVRDRVVFCGDTAGLASVRERDAGVRIALSWGPGPLPDASVWGRVRPQYFNPEWIALSEQVVVETHAAGRQVCTWTVDAPAEMARLSALGVDAIISNEIATLVATCPAPPGGGVRGGGRGHGSSPAQSGSAPSCGAGSPSG